MSTQCGYVAIVGRPNVGKSTLLNRILRQKISITSRKPQTTRHQILGVKTNGSFQAIYLDTPGMHQDAPRAINKVMHRAAESSLHEVDLIVWIVDATQWTELDDWIEAKIKHVKVPIILVLNKVDRLKDKTELLPKMANLSDQKNFAAILPISARRGTGVAALEREVEQRLPNADFMFDAEAVTDKSMRFMVAEIVREKLMRTLAKEVPYSVTVEVIQFKTQTEKNRIDISANIIVERASQKGIIIGKGGQKLKQIGTTARKDIEKLVGQKVFLQLWVVIKDNWADDAKHLKSLGFD